MRELVEKYLEERRASVNKEVYDFIVGYLKKEKKGGMVPERTFSGALMSDISDDMEKSGIKLSGDDNYKDFSASFRKAFKSVFGRGGFDAMKAANKRSR